MSVELTAWADMGSACKENVARKVASKAVTWPASSGRTATQIIASRAKSAARCQAGSPLGLVLADQQVDLGIGALAAQSLQGVYRIAGPIALDFDVVHADARPIAKGRLAHGQAVWCRAERVAFVPGLAGGNDAQFAQIQLRDGGLRQSNMAPMRRVKSPAKDADAFALTQTQSRRTRNLSYSAASALPGSGWCW